MEKGKVCRNLIKIANQFDNEGEYELANEVTAIAENIANTKVALNFGKLLGKRALMGLAGQASRKRMSLLQRAQVLDNPQLIQEATLLDQQVRVFNQKLTAAEKGQTQSTTSTIPNPQTGQANITTTSQPGASTVNPTVSAPPAIPITMPVPGVN